MGLLLELVIGALVLMLLIGIAAVVLTRMSARSDRQRAAAALRADISRRKALGYPIERLEHELELLEPLERGWLAKVRRERRLLGYQTREEHEK